MDTKYSTKKSEQKGGYTIMETMIAVSLFTVIMTVGMGALLNTNALQRKSQDLRSGLDNLSFILEDMSRNIRTGYNYRCSATVSETPLSCASGTTMFFEEAIAGAAGITSDQWGYRINSSNIEKTVDGGTNWIALNPSEMVISAASAISILGSETLASGNRQQPLVTIRLMGTITYKNVITPFSVQTAISQRVIDN